MKKILIVVLSAIASLGVAFGASVVASADETYTSLDELNGLTLEISFTDGFDTIYEEITTENAAILNIVFTSNGVNYNKMKLYTSNGERYYLDYGVDNNWTAAYNFDNSEWVDEELSTIAINDSQTITSNNNSLFLLMFNSYSTDITPEPEPAGNLWTSILTGIGGFLSGMFALISGAFTGVVSVFYANNTATIILQALIFAAAASLVAAAVYVIVRLIKSAVARLRGGVGAAGAKGDKNKKTKRFFSRKRR